MWISVEAKCPLCGTKRVVNVKAQDYQAWIDGTLAQNAFEYLDVSDREALMTGICDSCWETM